MLVPYSSLAILDVGGPEVLMIMLITLLLFGSDRLPALARGMGKAIREFKKATSGLEDELKRAMEEPPPKPRPPTRISVPPTSLQPPPGPSVNPAPPATPAAPAAPSPPPEDHPYPYP